MSEVATSSSDTNSGENLQLKIFKNQPKTTLESRNIKQDGPKRKSLQSLISIEPEPIPATKDDWNFNEDGIIQPEPNFIPMINSVLDNEADREAQSLFMTDFDSVEGASTINRLFFQNNSSNKLLVYLLKLRTQVCRINVSQFPVVYRNVSILHILMFLLFGTCNLVYFKYFRGKLMLKSKIIATIIANGLLNGVSDIIAQIITCSTTINNTKSRSNNNDRISLTQNSNENQLGNLNGGLDLEDLEYQTSLIDNDSIYYIDDSINNRPHDFQLWRLICFAMWGSFMANFQVPWYFILNMLFTEDPSIVQTLERILSDQLFYSPISLYVFFAFANYVMDAGDVFSFRSKLKKIFLNTLMLNYLIWPLMQFINFSFINKDDQPLFSSCISVVWNVLLSMRNASASK
ncbi:hypothetical protein QEN19_004207 [Hanseniaspora menglaensis]